MTVYTVVEVSEILGIDRHKTGRLIKSGSLRAKKVGNAWRIRKEWLEDFMESDDHGVTTPLTGKKRLELISMKDHAA